MGWRGMKDGCFPSTTLSVLEVDDEPPHSCVGALVAGSTPRGRARSLHLVMVSNRSSIPLLGC